MPLTLRVKTIFQQIYGVFKGAFFWMFSTDKHLLIICVLLSALSLSMNWQGSIFVLNAPHDSLRYIEMAQTIVEGRWLGDYDHMTLIRPPMYPLLLALNSLAGSHLHILQYGLYLFSIALLSISFRMLDVARWRVAVIFALCAFHPLTILPAFFVATESLYVPAVTAVVAGCLGILGSTHKGSWINYLFWLFVLSFSLILFWFTRPEGVWILPFVAVCFGFFLWRCRWDFRDCRLKIVTLVLIPMLVLAVMGHYFKAQNERNYGIDVIHELDEPNFKAAFSWLTRLAPESHRPYVPISKEAMTAAYKVSEHFALLRPYLSKQTNGRGWAKYGCEWMGICDELVNGWSMWAIRDAVASIGGYSTAEGASTFYGAVAREIREACEGGQLNCSANPTGNMLAPPLTWSYVPRIGYSALKMIGLIVSLGEFSGNVDSQEQVGESKKLLARYDRITHDQRPFKGIHFSPFYISAYKGIQVGGGLLVLGVVLMALGGRKIRGLNAIWKGQAYDKMLVSCLLVLITSRIVLIAYIDAISFWAQQRYLMPIYPCFIALIGLVLPEFKSIHSSVTAAWRGLFKVRV